MLNLWVLGIILLLAKVTLPRAIPFDPSTEELWLCLKLLSLAAQLLAGFEYLIPSFSEQR